MATEITLSIPDSVYQQAEEAAQTSNRPIETILADTLVDAFPSFPVHEQRGLMLQEQSAFEAMRQTLLEQFPGEYVAVHGGVVVDHDQDEYALIERLNKHYRDEIVHIQQVRPEPPPPLHFRSPRFVSGT